MNLNDRAAMTNQQLHTQTQHVRRANFFRLGSFLGWATTRCYELRE